MAALLLLTLLAGCPRPRVGDGRVTGTCEGACGHYMACKRVDEPATREACLSECREIFSSSETLREFERLDCEDVIGFVEGQSGRGPGQASVQE